MSNTKITAEVEIDFPDGKRVIDMAKKRNREIYDCDNGVVVMLHLRNGDMYTGFFKGIDDDDVLLGSLAGKNLIGLKLEWIDFYFEAVNK
jgi:hypothetical protein